MSDASSQLTRRLAYEAALAALAVVVGFALAALPNIELFTFVIFLSGVLLGPVSGLRVGFLAAIAYGILSPYGLPSPLLLAALVLARMGIGALGGLLRPVLFRARPRFRVALFALAALVSSLFFHTLTNLALGLTIGQWTSVLAGALPFAAVNVAVNVIEFAVLGLLCLRVVEMLPIPGLLPPSREKR